MHSRNIYEFNFANHKTLLQYKTAFMRQYKTAFDYIQDKTAAGVGSKTIKII